MNKKNIIITIISVLLLTYSFAFARTTTTDLGLVKPIWTEDIDILDDINANSDILEAFANDVLEFDLSLVMRSDLDVSTFSIEGVDATEFGYLDGVTSDIQTQIDAITPRTQEEIEDYAGAMWTGNTETGITITYQDSDGTIDAVIGAIAATDVSIALGTGSPTVDQLQEYFDNTGSAGYFTGGILSDGGSGTLNITAGEGFIRNTADDNAPLLSFKWSAVTGMAVPDDTTRYVFVDEAGLVTLNASEFVEAQDNIMLGVVTDEAAAITSVFNLGVRLEESIGQAGRFIRRIHSIARDNRKGGLAFGETGTRNITVSAGSLWWGRTEYEITALDTSVAGGFDTYTSAAKIASGATQYPNLQYDSAGTLTTLTNEFWAVLWFYLEPDDKVVMIYGRAQYETEAQAAEEGVPSTSLPNRISAAGIIMARFIFLKSAATASISLAFDTVFLGSGATDHGTLTGLGDDDHLQYLEDTIDDTTPELGGELDAGAHSIGFTLQTATGDGTTTIDWRLGNKFKFTFGAQADTFTFTAPTNPGTLMLTIIQDGTGSRTITWPGTVKWAGGVAPTLTTAGGSRDKIALDWDGTQYDAVASLDFK